MEDKSRSWMIGGSRIVLIPSGLAEWFFGEKHKTAGEMKVSIEDSSVGGKKLIIGLE